MIKKIILNLILLLNINYVFSQINENPNLVSTYKSNIYEILQMNIKKKYLIDTIHHEEKVSYHTINWKEKTITSIQYNQKNSRWEAFNLKFNNVTRKDWGIQYKVENEYCSGISLRNDNTLIYHLVNDESYVYYNLEKMEKGALENLNIFNRNEISKEPDYESFIYSTNRITDNFEYSDKWRKEAFKVSKQYIGQILNNNTPKCKVVSQGVYNATQVRYLGGQSYQVTITTKFDCNQDYINDCTFIISADYLGTNNWNFDVIKQWFND